ncbi:hypothetical protein NEF87_000589 [Candidatus Lokiarchaeum ossiferum]|uniref:Right-handed parallel beta-helix repeat-containing protein n=1 Tax=Candidatus Lokiarchaeum ossiferum TaxID=2951803 RepID=A0ABY6HLC1_9ARCH|nr:hypothetical protein NEF87_000589 [Candidatus Lokiarchaeum sp. B-35]
MYNLLHKRKDVVIIICLLFSSVIAANNSFSSIEETIIMNEENFDNIPRSLATFSNTSIIINALATDNDSHTGNWTWAASQPWCSGLGTESNPYLIEDVQFNIPAGETGLYIMDSNEIYFTIKNCAFNHSSLSSSVGPAIRFDRTTNGTIVDCNISTNSYGIYLHSGCSWNNFTNNKIYNCYTAGIRLGWSCSYNEIVRNNIDTITNGDGIYFMRNSDFNNLFQNNCSNSETGIDIEYNCNSNYLDQNYCFENSAGIEVESGDYNVIYNNTITKNNGPSAISYGITLNKISIEDGSNFNNISSNNISDNYQGGICVSFGQKNIIHNNTLFHNDYMSSTYLKGILLISSTKNQIFNNTGVESGVYLSMANNNSIYSNVFKSAYRAIDVRDSSYIDVVDNIIEDSRYGIYISNGRENNLTGNSMLDIIQYGFYFNEQDNSTIKLNSIDGCRVGISSDGSESAPGENNSIIENQISRSEYCDMYLQHSDFWKLKNNDMGGSGLMIQDCFNNDIDQSNMVNSSPILVLEEQNNLVLDGGNMPIYSQLFIVDSVNTTIQNFNHSGLAMGLSIVGGNNLLIQNNNLSNNEYYGLYLNNINNSIVSENVFNNNYLGISIDARMKNTWDEFNPDLSLLQHNLTFIENDANDNSAYGLECELSAYNLFEENSFNNNDEFGMNFLYTYNSVINYTAICNNGNGGLNLDYSHENQISLNQIVNNSGIGINLDYSNQTLIKQCLVESNEDGIYIYDSLNSIIEDNILFLNEYSGVSLEYSNQSTINNNIISNSSSTGIWLFDESGENIIFNNWFYNNSLHAQDDCIGNQWYFSSKGNYWDSYTGTDDDHDGIGDQPHPIAGDANTMDIYPIHDVDAPVIFTVDSILISGKNNYEISWDVTDFNPDDYSILLDGEILISDQQWQNGAIKYTIPANTLEDGSYNYSLQVEDKYGNQKTAETTVHVDGTSPIISSISTYNITGKINLTLNWSINDTHPLYFVVSQNQSLQTSPVAWENGSVSYTIPALSLDDGNYLYQIWVNDSLGNTRVFDTLVVVDGTAPTINSNQDLILSSNTSSILLNWTVDDLHPGVYSISVNGTVVITSAAWINGLIYYNYSLADLPAGNYTIQITVYDSFGNSVVNSIQISIPAGVDENDPINPWVLVIVGIAIGGGVVGLIVVIKRAKEDND